MILVIGATGHVGREVVSRLLRDGAAVRALTRRPGASGLPPGVDVVGGDVTVPDTVTAALADVDTVFLVWPFTNAEAAPAVVNSLARQARRIVYLSSMGRPDARGRRTEPIPLHAEMERLISDSGVEATFLRPSGFATNTLMWAPQIRDGGVVAWPYGAAARSLIHEADIAAVAVKALTGGPVHDSVHLLTGPATLTQVEQVAAIGDAIGRTLRYEEISREAVRPHLVSAFGDPAFADSALDTWARFTREPELVTRTVEEITGRPARSFREWAADHAADFAGPGPASAG